MSESIEIKIKLSSTNWEDRFPGARIYFNNELIKDLGKISEPIEFTIDQQIDEVKHKISIEMYGKMPGDTQQDEGKDIINDVLLNIDSIEFDEIDISNLAYNLSVYYPNDDHAPGVVQGCINLGWNGRWDLEFESPVYLWLLENMEY